MIELDFKLPLDRFELRIQTRLATRAVAIMGPSGCGKTSLLEAVAGLRRRASGRIAMDGEILLDTAARIALKPERRRVGYVPQDAALFPHLSVAGNVRFGLAASAQSRNVFDEAVSILEIAPLLGRYPATLSGGERQRVALARALATRPRLLLLDEPLAAIDVELKERIFPYILRIRDRADTAIIYVTHNLGEAIGFAHEALLMRAGSIEAQGAPGEVFDVKRLTALDGGVAFDNIVSGSLLPAASPAEAPRLRLANGTELSVPGDSPSAPLDATYSVPTEDVLLSSHPLQGISARNLLGGVIIGIDAVGADALVRVAAGGVHWRAKLTSVSVAELGLTVDREVTIAIKTHSFRRLR